MIARAIALAPISGVNGIIVTPIPKQPVAANPDRIPAMTFAVFPEVSRKEGTGKWTKSGDFRVEELEIDGVEWVTKTLIYEIRVNYIANSINLEI